MPRKSSKPDAEPAGDAARLLAAHGPVATTRIRKCRGIDGASHRAVPRRACGSRRPGQHQLAK
jgi:hypothetical protein